MIFQLSIREVKEYNKLLCLFIHVTFVPLQSIASLLSYLLFHLSINVLICTALNFLFAWYVQTICFIVCLIRGFIHVCKLVLNANKTCKNRTCKFCICVNLRKNHIVYVAKV